MAMSIAERMALQASRMKAATKVKPAPKPAPKTGAAMSAADRMRKQLAVKTSVPSPRAGQQPPSASAPKASLTIAQRIAKSVSAKTQQANAATGGVHGASNQAVIAKYKTEYEKFLAKLETMDFGAMFFNPAAPAEKTEVPAEVAANVNGISTAEGEIVVEAVQAEPDGRVNEVPVTVPEEKPARPKRTRKAKAKQEAEPVVVETEDTVGSEV